MTKMDMAEILVSSPAWGGDRSASYLCKHYTKQEIKDWYDDLRFTEEDFYDSIYG